MIGRLKREAAVAAALGAVTVMVIPASVSAGLLDDAGRGLNDTVRGLTGAGASGGTPAPAPGSSPAPLAATTDPAPSTADPHAQGTVLELDVVETPLTAGPDDVVVGRATATQEGGPGGPYSGKVTVVSALGYEVAVETDEGERQQSPVAPVNDLLDSICAQSGSNVCLKALDYSSSTEEDGSSNSFEAASANAGDGMVTSGLVASNGNISEDGDCQVAHGDSSAAEAGALGAVDVSALESDSDSFACRDGGKGAGATSSVLTLNGTGVLAPLGCDENTADDRFGVPLLLEGVCNGDTTSQAVPLNVRRALQLDVLPGLDALAPTDLLRASGGSSETLASTAPRGPNPECPDPGNPRCDGGDGNPPYSGGPPAEGSGAGPGAHGGPTADRRGGSELPFTGLDVAIMLAIALGVIGAGLGLMGVADRRRRRPMTAR